MAVYVVLVYRVGWTARNFFVSQKLSYTNTSLYCLQII